MKFRPAVLAILAVLAVHLAFLKLGVYDAYVNTDIFMHLAGGFVMGLLGIAIQNSAREQGKTPLWMAFLFTVSFAVFVGVLWEFYEFTSDHLLHTLTQPSLRDTMADLLNDLIGGLAAGTAFIKFLK